MNLAISYRWQDLDLRHDFHSTKQGIRPTISATARREVLEHAVRCKHRLLQLNYEQLCYAKGIDTLKKLPKVYTIRRRQKAKRRKQKGRLAKSNSRMLNQTGNNSSCCNRVSAYY